MEERHMAIGPVQLIVLGFDHPDFHFRISDGFISPLDLVAIGLMTGEEAKELHALERARAAKS
jgi:hypothetical protein